VRLRLSWEEWSNPEIPFLIARHLEGLHVPCPWSANPWSYYANTLAERLTDVVEPVDYDLLPAKAIEQTFDSLWQSRGAQLIGDGLGPKLVAFDYFELLQDINRAAAFKGVHVICCRQARAKPGQTAMKRLERIVPMDAEMANTDAGILFQLVRQMDKPDWDSPEAEQGERLARDAYLWEGGETEEASDAEVLMWRKARIKYLDEPVSKQRRWTEEETMGIAGGAQPAQERWLRRNLRSLTFTDVHARLLSHIEQNLIALGRSSEFDSIVQHNAHRFDGSRTRVDVLAGFAHRRGDTALEEKLRTEAVQANVDDWNGYWNLGWMYAERGDLPAAQKILFAYPKFHAGADNPVELGNEASQGAGVLLRAGEPELAKPLLELCANLDTGSAAQMHCEERLAVMAGDYAAATSHAQHSLERYPTYSTAVPYIRYLFLTGRNDEAWKAFDRWSARMFDDQIQDAAVYGDRVLGRSDQEIVDAAQRWSVREDYPGRLAWHRDERMFMALFPDRDASEQTVALFQSSAKGPVARLYVGLARGYLAFQRRDYKAALEAWRDVDQHLTGDSFQRGEAKNFLVPYSAVAYALAGDSDGGRKRLEVYAARFPRTTETFMLNAVTAALKSQPEQAKRAVWTAFLHAGGGAWQPLEDRLAILEVLEALFDHTHDEHYRDLILELAQRQERIEERGYAYAFEAKYARSKADQVRALAYALYLDRSSLRIRSFSEIQKREALAWWAETKRF